MTCKSSSLILLLAVLLLLSACASIKSADQKAVLRGELSKWENFSSDGVIQVNYMGLSMRKMFVLSKTREEARLDVLDGGAFGISPTPLVSVYMGDYVAIQAPMMPKLEAMSQSIRDNDLSLRLLSDPDSLISMYGDTVIATHKLTLDNSELSFTDKMQLDKVIDLKSGSEMRISYTSKGDPDKVTITIDSATSLELLIDKTSYGKAEVISLPPNVLSPLMEQLKEVMDAVQADEDILQP